MAREGNVSIESAPDGLLDDNIPKRVVYINDPKASNKRYEYAGNTVRTSKYTIVSFLPRNLFEQFHRVAYVYFLIIVILNQIPQLAVFGRTASLFPLVFVLVVTAIKDAYEDWGRHQSDTRENNRLSCVFQDGQFGLKKWKRIMVGELIKICENETVPCDIVLLSTSDPTGVAYIQTVNLDGESNLKTRYARQETISKNPELGSITGCLYCEEPNRNIYEFTAYIDLDGLQLPLGPGNVILRGCEVKNTPWIVGVVVYAGQETKAMLNSSGAQSKRSHLEKQMNREVAWLAVFLLVISFVGGLGTGLWLESHNSQLDTLPFYSKHDNNKYSGKVGEAVFAFLSCIISFQIMVPISLYISMELVRLGQTYFMCRDVDMYHSNSDTRFQARALNINEDLGQVKYVFSDKTGTLTDNIMEFQTAAIDGVDYANAKAYTDSVDVSKSSAGTDDASWPQGHPEKQTWRPREGAMVDPRLAYVLQGPAGTPEWRVAHDFMLALATCNTVVPSSLSTPVQGVDGTDNLKYQGESPDELALVSAASAYGYCLMERTSEYIILSVLGVTQRFDVLGVHEFDSIRKRMSVVLRSADGTVQVFVKGADTEVLDKVAVHSAAHKQSKHEADVMLATLSYLDQYAREGLRTLVVAAKQLSAADLSAWHAVHAKASISMRNRAGMMRSAADLVEINLTLLGATGIEDKLQDGVPETIAALREAGMKVWVLTGDKQETAISIGFSCLLLTRDMEQIIINESSLDGCRNAIMQAKWKYGVSTKGLQRSNRSHRKARRRENIREANAAAGQGASGFGADEPEPTISSISSSAEDDEQLKSRQLRRKTGLPLALIIDGNSLVHALSQDLEEELLELAMACKVVVCCRVAPLQKAGLVSLVKRRSKEITLAVGDGANDVSMIQMADVGVGISGQEGRQAVMASDFAVGQFKFLRKLLLVHGHWNYERLAYMVLYNLYRNAVFVMMLFWFILYTAFSSSPALSDWNLVFYSLIYTSVPTIVAGILDKDVEARTLLNYPALYGSGQRGESYNKVLFWSTMLDTLWQSLVLFYAVYFTYQRTDVDVDSLGDLWTIVVVILVNAQLALHVRTWTWIHHVVFWGSIAATFISILVMDALTIPGLLPYHWVLFRLIASARFWLDIILVVFIALLPHFFIQAMKVRLFPSDVDIARELENQGRDVDLSEHLAVELSEVPGA